MTDRTRRVLVTGASGFIGRHCLRRLLSDDWGELHAVNRAGDGPDSGPVTWHAADLSDAGEAARLIAAIRPTHLLHAAWIATPGIYATAPENLDWLQAGISLLRAFGEKGGIRFVGIGTSYEYSESSEPCREDETPTLPSTLYGKCKLAMAIAAQAAGQRYGFTAAWGRLFVPYGPGDAAARLIPSLSAALAAGREIPTTTGEQLRDFLFAPDAADLLVRLLASTEPGAFNVGSGEAVTVRSVIAQIATHHSAPHLIRAGAIPTRVGETPVLVADMTKVRQCLGWTAPTPLAAGLALTLANLHPISAAAARPDQTRELHAHNR